MLAERKREYEIGALERKRKEEEVNVWDHWEVGIVILRQRLVSVPCFLHTVHFCKFVQSGRLIYTHLQHARDELQTDMVAETNRKRRKLERERRALERPVGGKAPFDVLRSKSWILPDFCGMRFFPFAVHMRTLSPERSLFFVISLTDCSLQLEASRFQSSILRQLQPFERLSTQHPFLLTLYTLSPTQAKNY